MANIESLKPFQSGYDPRRNTKGRSKGSGNITTTLKKMLKRQVLVGGEKMALEKMLAERVIDKAIKGDRVMIKLIWEYMDGKPPTQKSRPYERYE